MTDVDAQVMQEALRAWNKRAYLTLYKGNKEASMFESIDDCGLTKEQAFAVGDPIAHAEAQATVLANAMQAAFDNAENGGHFFLDIASLMQVMKAHQAYLSELRLVVAKYAQKHTAPVEPARALH